MEFSGSTSPHPLTVLLASHVDSHPCYEGWHWLHLAGGATACVAVTILALQLAPHRGKLADLCVYHASRGRLVPLVSSRALRDGWAPKWLGPWTPSSWEPRTAIASLAAKLVVAAALIWMTRRPLGLAITFVVVSVSLFLMQLVWPRFVNPVSNAVLSCLQAIAMVSCAVGLGVVLVDDASDATTVIMLLVSWGVTVVATLAYLTARHCYAQRARHSVHPLVEDGVNSDGGLRSPVDTEEAVAAIPIDSATVHGNASNAVVPAAVIAQPVTTKPDENEEAEVLPAGETPSKRDGTATSSPTALATKAKVDGGDDTTTPPVAASVISILPADIPVDEKELLVYASGLDPEHETILGEGVTVTCEQYVVSAPDPVWRVLTAVTWRFSRLSLADPTARRYRVKPAVLAVRNMIGRARFVADIGQYHKLFDDSVHPLLPLLRAAFLNIRTATVTGECDLVVTYLPQYVCIRAVWQ